MDESIIVRYENAQWGENNVKSSRKANQNKRIYQVKVLDVKFQQEFNFLSLNYIRYKVRAEDQGQALEKAQALYMKGEEGVSHEELPILLKLFCTEST